MLPRRWIICLTLCATVILLLIKADAALQTHSVTWDARRVSYQFEDASFDVLKKIRWQLEADGRGEVSGWGQKSAVIVTAADYSASAEVDAVYIDGNASLAINANFIEGQSPAAGDNTGCAIDEKTAMNVFGSTNIIGCAIKIDEVYMEVRGVFSSNGERGLALCPASLLGDETKMHALAFLLFPGGARTESEQAETLMLYGGLSDSKSNDHDFEYELINWCKGLASNICQIIFLSALLYMLRHVLSNFVFPFPAGSVCAVYRIILAALGFRLLYASPPPTSMLPTRWSDFAFWPELLIQCRASMEGFLLSGTGRIRLMELLSIAEIFGLYVLSILVSLCAWRALYILIDTQFEGGYVR